MFDRTIVRHLKEWAVSSRRKPLLLRGARQTGKTTAVRLFAAGRPGYLEVNLEAPGERGVSSESFRSGTFSVL